MSIPRRIEVLGLGGAKALARAQEAATSAAAAVTSATSKATEAVAAALEAKGYRDQASEITGLPTEAAAQAYNIENDPDVKAALFASYGVFVNAADPRFGVTRDQAQINNAIAYAQSLGGGTVSVLAKDGPWSITRSISTDQKKGGIHVTGPNVTLFSDGAQLTLAGNCDFVRASSALGAQVTITADTLPADTQLTVVDSSSFAVGADVFVRLGQAVYDAGEPDFWLFAKVAVVNDATHITLDRPVGYAMSVAATPTASQRSVAPFISLVENFRMAGTWDFYNPKVGQANAEGGVRLDHVKGFSFDVLRGTDPGAGVLNCHFVDGITGQAVKSPQSLRQNGQLSKGRVLSVSEVRGMNIGVVEAENFEGTPIVAESRVEAARIGVITLRNNNPARSTSTEPLISTLGRAHLDVGGLQVTGKGSLMRADGGTAGNTLTVGDAFFYTAQRPKIDRLDVVQRTLYVERELFGPPRVEQVVIPLAANMSAVEFTLPAGYLRRIRARASSVTGVTSFRLGTTGQVTNDLTALLVSGATVDLGGQGSGFDSTSYSASFSKPKRLLVSTDSTVPGGAHVVLEIHYFADPAANPVGEFRLARAVAGAASILIQPEELGVVTGTPTLGTAAGRWRAWLLDQATQERVAGVVRIPSDWTSARLELLWYNAGASSGDVRWATNIDSVAAGATLNTSGPSADVVATAGTQDVLVRTAIGTFAVTAGNLHGLRIARDAAAGSDTLPNDAGLLAAILTSAS
jgi:hypothetical protein